MPRHESESWGQYLGPGAVSSWAIAMASSIFTLGLPVWFRLAQVVKTARVDEVEPADAILVLGRSLKNDHPTEVFLERLRHGHGLWRQRIAPRVVVAGGLTGNARRTEAEAGKEVLLGLGMPEEAVICEDRSRHTLENLAHTREAMREAGWQKLVVVSDPLHLARVAAYARGFGLEAAFSPASKAPPRTGSAAWWLRAVKEAYLVHWYHSGVAYSR
ncbi:MAG TPA: YdcF family protein, partial [Thermoanaerobaculia bacterium]|nr:YdcF family protein [Thermoanaerobaculia bacterium]